jgi:ribosome-binding factor A
MASRRAERVGHEVRAVIAELLLREARDPAMATIVVTGVKVTADLGLARVYYRLLLAEGELERGRRGAARGLRRATGWMRSEVGKRLGLRTTPALAFHYDEGQDRAMRVSTLLKEIGAGDGGPALDEAVRARREDDDDLGDGDEGDEDDDGLGDDDEEEGYGEPPDDTD